MVKRLGFHQLPSQASQKKNTAFHTDPKQAYQQRVIRHENSWKKERKSEISLVSETSENHRVSGKAS